MQYIHAMSTPVCELFMQMLSYAVQIRVALAQGTPPPPCPLGSAQSGSTHEEHLT